MEEGINHVLDNHGYALGGHKLAPQWHSHASIPTDNAAYRPAPARPPHPAPHRTWACWLPMRGPMLASSCELVPCTSNAKYLGTRGCEVPDVCGTATTRHAAGKYNLSCSGPLDAPARVSLLASSGAGGLHCPRGSRKKGTHRSESVAEVEWQASNGRRGTAGSAGKQQQQPQALRHDG